jgi:hypothetical protein
VNPDQNLQCVKALCVSIDGYMDSIMESMMTVYALEGMNPTTSANKAELAKAQAMAAMRLKAMQTSATALATLAGTSLEHVMAVKP